MYGMKRSIVSLPEDDMRWLKRQSRLHGRSMAETIRLAIGAYRRTSGPDAYHKVLKETAGSWSSVNEDGQQMVDRLRDEWER